MTTGNRHASTVRRRLTILALAATFIGLTAAGISYWAGTAARSASRDIELRLLPAQTALTGLDRQYRDIETDLPILAGGRDPKVLDALNAQRFSAADRIQALRALLAADSGPLADVGALERSATAWFEQTVDPATSGDPAVAPDGTSDADIARFAQTRSDLTTLSNDLTKQVTRQQTRSRQTTDLLRRVALAFGLSVLIEGLLFYRTIRHAITRHLDHLVAQIGTVASGGLEQRIDARGPADLASVGAAAESMRLRLLDDARGRIDSALIAGHEAESARIAGQIHDDQVQAMTLASLRLQQLRRRIGEDEQLKPLALAAEQATNNAIARLRRMIFELHSPVLESDGLLAAIEAYLDETFDDTIQWTVSGSASDIPPNTAGLAYRLAREAMWNTFKHAKANRIDVVVATEVNVLAVEIADDGLGFDASVTAAPVAGHLGFDHSRQLAQAAAGNWTVSSAPGHGTRVRFTIPLQS